MNTDDEDIYKNTVNIAFCIDETYVPHLATLMVSIRSTQTLSICCHIVTPQLTDESTMGLQQLATDSFSIKMYPVTSSLFNQLNLSERYNQRVTIATYYRLLLPKLLPSELKRVIYLDADMLCVNNLEPLWHADLEEKCVGAVADGALTAQQRWKTLGYTIKQYFNAGMLVIDLPKWKERKVSESSWELAKHNAFFEYNDQDILNLVAYNDVTLLSVQWNCQTYHFQRDSIGTDVALVHFTGAEKPWHVASEHPFKAAYWNCRNMTNFKRDKMDVYLTHQDKALLTELTNRLSDRNGGEIVICGAGQKGRRIYHGIRQNISNNSVVIGFFDSYREGSYLDLPIKSNINAYPHNATFIIASDVYTLELSNHLVCNNISPDHIVSLEK